MATRHASPGSGQPEQLALLQHTELPVQFRLDERTRQRGLAHLAAIRRQLEAQAARRKGTAKTAVTEPRRRRAA